MFKMSKMSCGLFSMFDPVSNLPVLGSFGAKWVLIIPAFLVFPWQLMALPCSASGVFGIFAVKSIFELTRSSNVVFVSIFTVILGVNLSSLTPLSYAPSAHPGFVLPLSVALFLPSILGWVTTKGLRSFASHLLPSGSPSLLWGFLVLVETVSVMIRPITLAIRLVANIMAGHIFIDMLTNFATEFSPMLFPLNVSLFAGLMGFETAVSVVQALVFTNLLAMFWLEQKEEEH